MTDKRPRYDDEYRASAILMLEAAGWPNTPGAMSRVARHLGLNRQTLARWAHGQQNPPPPQLVSGLKRDITELLDDIIHGAASEVKRRIDASELDDTTLPQLMTAMGIAVDKRQLLTGKPTAINEDHVSDSRNTIQRKFTEAATGSAAPEVPKLPH